MKRIITFFFLIGFILFFIPQVMAAEKGVSENSCVNCHKTVIPFIQEQQRFNQIRIQHLERNVGCSLDCHADRVRQLARDNYQQWLESKHYLKGITCEYCHGGDPGQTIKEKAHANFKNMTDPESPVYYTNVPKTCGNCHTKELASFESSKHYQTLEALKLAPTCTTCHAPHTFKILNPEDFRYLCGNCHSVTKKVAPYDIPVQAEYLLGKVNKLKFSIDMANQDIFWAKKNGTDVTQAQERVDAAVKTLDSLAVLWHEFNLTHFENAVDSASRDVKKAEDIVNPPQTPSKTEVPKTPGFVALPGIISMLAALYILKKKRD